MLTDAFFAVAQTAIALAIAWRPTVKIGLAVSIAWAVGVWWVGEGLGGVLNGTANPVNGAPGAVMIYALLAVLLWPSDRPGQKAPFIAARAVGAPIAKGLWLVLWGSLSYFAVLGANRSSQGLHNLITTEANGEPGWLAWIDHHAASVVDHRGLAVTLVLAILLLVVAVGTYLPPPLANATVALAAADGSDVLGGGRELRSALHQRGHRRELRSAPDTAGCRLLEMDPTHRSCPTPRILRWSLAGA